MAKILTMTGHLREQSPRAADWKVVFGTLGVPLRGVLPIPIQTPDGPQKAYFVDVDRLSEDVRRRVIEHTARTFGLPEAEVEKDLLGEHGLPILAEDVIVSADVRLFL
jgi:hypothetical protein